MNKPHKITNEQANMLISELDYQNQVITKLLIETGVRITDILHLTVKNVEKGQIIERKTKKKRKLELNEELKNELTGYINDYRVSNLLFYQKRNPNLPMHRSTYYRALKHASDATGVKVSPHSFRKLYAQNIYAQTRDIYSVQSALNHKYIQTTAGYLDIDITELIESATVGGADGEESASNPSKVQNPTVATPRAGRWFLSCLAPALLGGRSAFAFVFRWVVLPPAKVARRAGVFLWRGLCRRASFPVFRSARVVKRGFLTVAAWVKTITKRRPK